MLSRTRDDQGVVAVLLALMTVPLLFAIGAVVVDIGVLYGEKRQLQNGADAAAFAIADGCIRSSSTCSGAAAQGSSNNNALDGASTIKDVCGVTVQSPNPAPTPGVNQLPPCSAAAVCAATPTAATPAAGSTYVRVTTGTRTASGATSMPNIFSRALGLTAGTPACAAATVSWGAPAYSKALPVVFSACEFYRLNPSGAPADPGSGTPAVISFGVDSRDSCTGKSAPGSFGYLLTADDASACSTPAASNGTLQGDPGNDGPGGKSGTKPANNCASTMFATDQSYPGAAGQAGGHNELIPLVNAVAGVGVNVVYTIVGYAEFFITGWNFSGNSYSGSAGSPPCSGSDRCIAGYFVRYLDRSAAPGSGTTSYGAASSRLAG